LFDAFFAAADGQACCQNPGGRTSIPVLPGQRNNRARQTALGKQQTSPLTCCIYEKQNPLANAEGGFMSLVAGARNRRYLHLDFVKLLQN